ncbi:Rossmann-fold NAD(P)-binding domain-containing protein [Kineococcus sp. SYSU DK003]|uniref:hypothetical protein n=1 Tax=Kineococcus sp. SYSU DK003 TaxID=3383124 RepID=UPI003D7C866D
MSRGIRNPALPTVSGPAKVGAELIAGVEQSPAPQRLVNGSDSFAIVRAALRERLTDVGAQEAGAASTGLTGAVAG